MKKLSKYLVVPCLAMMMVGCTDLEENLNGEVTETFEIPGIDDGGGGGDILTGVFGELRGAGTANHGSYYSLQELTSDEMCIGAKGGDWFDGGILIELHRHTYTPTHDFVKNAWNNTYNAIGSVNTLLAGGSLDNNQVAQARVLRAYLYLRLMDSYGNVKIVTAPDTDVAQSSRSEVFDFVESEILDALGVNMITDGMDLSNSDLGVDPNTYRINIYGALGIISKLYLNAEVYTGTARWTEAASAAGYVIDNGPYMLCDDGCTVPNLGKKAGVASDPDNLEGYAAVFAPNNEGNPEHILSVFYDEATGGGMNFGQMNLHYGSQFSYNFDAQPWNGYSTLEEFYNSYEDGDARKANNFLVGPQLDFAGTPVLDYASDDDDIQLNYTPEINELAPNYRREAGARPAKFSFKQFGRPDMDNDYPIVRLGDMYLTRAEGLARAAGDWSLAMNDVNIIRARAKVGAMTSMDADMFLAERGREMYQESARRTDLIRFDKFNSEWWEKPISPDYVNIFPIPQEQIDAATNLTQNPGY